PHQRGLDAFADAERHVVEQWPPVGQHIRQMSDLDVSHDTSPPRPPWRVPAGYAASIRFFRRSLCRHPMAAPASATTATGDTRPLRGLRTRSGSAPATPRPRSPSDASMSGPRVDVAVGPAVEEFGVVAD